jgi:hypothetical protein
MRTREQLLTDENVRTYLNGLEKVFSGDALTANEATLTREMNAALELDPHLEEKILDNLLAPVTSTYSGMKLIFHEGEGKERKVSPAADDREPEWKFVRNAAASKGKLYHRIKDKIEKVDLEMVEGGRETRKFHIDMHLDAAVTLHLEVNPVGTRWLVVPTASCPIVYKGGEGIEKMQTRFKSLRLKLEELKNKGIFLEKGKIIIK